MNTCVYEECTGLNWGGRARKFVIGSKFWPEMLCKKVHICEKSEGDAAFIVLTFGEVCIFTNREHPQRIMKFLLSVVLALTLMPSSLSLEQVGVRGVDSSAERQLSDDSPTHEPTYEPTHAPGTMSVQAITMVRPAEMLLILEHCHWEILITETNVFCCNTFSGG